MKAIIILALICTLSLQAAVLLRSSPDNTIITAPSNYHTVYEEYYEKYYPNYLGSQAHWIYKNGTGGWPLNDYATFYTVFYADCTDDAYLYITADDVFSASVNGG
jgi:hypothetical protein